MFLSSVLQLLLTHFHHFFFGSKALQLVKQVNKTIINHALFTSKTQMVSWTNFLSLLSKLYYSSLEAWLLHNILLCSCSLCVSPNKKSGDVWIFIQEKVLGIPSKQGVRRHPASLAHLSGTSHFFVTLPLQDNLSSFHCWLSYSLSCATTSTFAHSCHHSSADWLSYSLTCANTSTLAHSISSFFCFHVNVLVYLWLLTHMHWVKSTFLCLLHVHTHMHTQVFEITFGSRTISGQFLHLTD